MANNIVTIMEFGLGVGAFFSIIPFIWGYGIYNLLSIFEYIASLV